MKMFQIIQLQPTEKQFALEYKYKCLPYLSCLFANTKQPTDTYFEVFDPCHFVQLLQIDKLGRVAMMLQPLVTGVVVHVPSTYHFLELSGKSAQMEAFSGCLRLEVKLSLF